LIELTNLYWNSYENFGSFLQSPTAGYTHEFNNKWLLDLIAG